MSQSAYQLLIPGVRTWTKEVMRIMTDEINWVALGREHFRRHRQCTLSQGHFPVENSPGWMAIRVWYPPEDQGATRMMLQRPHDAWRTQWVQGWDEAREEYLAEMAPKEPLASSADQAEPSLPSSPQSGGS